VAIALPALGAFMARRSERRSEFHLEHRLDGFSHLLAKLNFQVLAELQDRSNSEAR
jgi:hypothetical protein